MKSNAAERLLGFLHFGRKDLSEYLFVEPLLHLLVKTSLKVSFFCSSKFLRD
jgi:hypothetical protein